MFFSEIKPYIRFARILHMDKVSHFPPNIPYDARLFYTISGHGSIKVCNKKFEMKKRSLILINSGVEYQLLNPEQPVSYIAVNFDYTFNQSKQSEPVAPDTLNNYDQDRLIENVSFSDIPEFDKYSYFENMQSAESDLYNLEKEYTQKLIMHDKTASSLMTNILIKCFRSKKAQTSTNGYCEIIDNIINYIHSNYDKNLSNKKISEVFSYHPNYISSMIKQYTGLPLHQYLLNIKISKATEMISEGNKTLAQISTLCGFYDVCHFSKCFKNSIGMSPREYLSKYR